MAFSFEGKHHGETQQPLGVTLFGSPAFEGQHEGAIGLASAKGSQIVASLEIRKTLERAGSSSRTDQGWWTIRPRGKGGGDIASQIPRRSVTISAKNAEIVLQSLLAGLWT